MYNNTCLGEGIGGIAQPDSGDQFSTLQAGLQIYNNLFALPAGKPGLLKWAGLVEQSPTMPQTQLAFAGYNAIQGANPMYQGIQAPNANAVPNPQYNRDVIPTNVNGYYNLDLTRNLLGAAIQNSTYSVAKNSTALRLTVNSASDMTLAFSVNNGSTYGNESQLNWQAAGTTYTVSTVTDPGVVLDYLTITVPVTDVPTTGGPFMATNNTNGSSSPYEGTASGCPVARWAKITSAAGTIPVGTAFAIVRCLGTVDTPTNQLVIVPRDTRLVANDVFAIIRPEVRACEVDCTSPTDYVDVGIDARSIPSSTLSDTGINLTLTDYCASGCGSTAQPTGLPTAPVTGNLPLMPFGMPEEGGVANHAFRSWRLLPTNSLWVTQSSTGSYIGAILPPPRATIGAAGLFQGVD